jgi:hypothetical protein
MADINDFNSLPWGGLMYPDSKDDKPTTTLVNMVHEPFDPPPGALVLLDPYKMYLKSLPPRQTPDQLVVAKDSSALQSIFPLINHNLKVKAIIDPGLQIVTMSEDVCMELALIYDPSVVLNMQSVNGEVNQSLRLARNILLQIGNITLYVQIHNLAYDILLGQPFDVLMESII